ncbi:MAG: hypothetical protein ABFS43_11910 [Thermodesulfobacteriota bacterium]
MKSIFFFSMIFFLFSCAHAPDQTQIQEEVYRYNDVDSFMEWLDAQPGVWNVKANKQIYLTSSPPKVVVIYSDRGGKKKLLIAVEPDQNLKLVKPE